MGKTWNPTVAGILDIIAWCYSFGWGLIFIVLLSVGNEILGYLGFKELEFMQLFLPSYFW